MVLINPVNVTQPGLNIYSTLKQIRKPSVLYQQNILFFVCFVMRVVPRKKSKRKDWVENNSKIGFKPETEGTEKT